MLPIVGDLIDASVNMFKSYFPPNLTPEEKSKLEEGTQQFKTQITTKLMDYYENELSKQADIVRTEAQSDSWLTKNWRPITMMTFVIIIANNYIIYPYLSLFFAKAPMLPIPADMWQLLKIGLGGYVVGRSVEKAVKSYKGK